MCTKKQILRRCLTPDSGLEGAPTVLIASAFSSLVTPVLLPLSPNVLSFISFLHSLQMLSTLLFKSTSQSKQGGQEVQRQAFPTPSGMIFRGVASGIGLVSEAVHHHKAKKNPTGNENNRRAALTQEYQVPQDDMSRQMDEASWELDEAQDRIGQYVIEPPYTADEEEHAVESFLQHHSSPSGQAYLPLSLPVLIAQRRPGRRSRGFVRAYAPVLDEVGINQAAFLDFIDHLNKAVMPNGLIQALNLASLAALHAPEPVTLAVAISLQVATRTADAVQSRVQTNRFLDKMNHSFFGPRGLVALVMTWKQNRPDDTFMTVSFDTQQTVASATNKQNNGLLKKLQGSNGATSCDWPEMAPLVFPLLDDAAARETEGAVAKKFSTVKRSGKFVEEYLDKRARAKWAGQNPESRMANSLPKEEFHSRYSDPNHPASSGDPIALLSGGLLQDPLRNALRNGNSRRGIGRSGLLRGAGGANNLLVPLIEGVTRPLQEVSVYADICRKCADLSTEHFISPHCPATN
jgi:hypothetical protein